MPRYSMGQMKALLLEDEPLMAMDFETSLVTAGFAVTTAMSVADAEEWLERNRPDVVIVDIVLRDGTSESVVARLVEDRIPFVVDSGDLPSQHDGTPFQHGVWLNKPSGAAELEAAITAALKAASDQQQP